jgi:hypothetical protein
MIANDIEMAPMSSMTSFGSYQQAAATPAASDFLRQPEAIVAPESIRPDDARWTAYRLRRTTGDLSDMSADDQGLNIEPSSSVAATTSLRPSNSEERPSGRRVLLRV